MFLLRMFLIYILMVNLMICDGAKNVAFCEPITRVGILPFQIYSKEKVDYLREIISSSLAQQLNENKQITVVDLKDLDTVLSKEFAKEGFSTEELDSISQETGVYFLVYGSLTKIANTLSLDSRVFANLEGSPNYKDFVEGKDLNSMIKKVGNNVSNHIIKSADQYAPKEITVEQSSILEKDTNIAPPLEAAPEFESKLPEQSALPTQDTKESIIKTPAPSDSAPTTPDTSSKVAEAAIAPKKETPKARNILSHQPINITSDRMEANNKNQTVIFMGNVVAKREDMVIFSNQISTLYTKGGEIIKITAQGSVKINQDDRIATCEEAVFLQPSQKIILTGNPKVWQGNNIVKGEKITILLDEDKIEIQGGKQNRVNAIIYPTGKKTE